jgi:hypothetical protein
MPLRHPFLEELKFDKKVVIIILLFIYSVNILSLPGITLALASTIHHEEMDNGNLCLG